MLAAYQRDDGAPALPPSAPEAEGHRFEAGELALTKRVILDNETIGTIYLKSDLSELAAFRRESLLALALMVLLSSAVAYALSAMVQKVISEPIFELARRRRSGGRARPEDLERISKATHRDARGGERRPGRDRRRPAIRFASVKRVRGPRGRDPRS